MSLWQICGVCSAISSQTQNSPLIVRGASLGRLLARYGSPVIPQWKKFKEFVSDHRIYEAVQKSFMNGRERGNSSEPVGFLPFFLFCLFSFGTSHGKKKELRRNSGKFSALAYLCFHWNTELSSCYPQWELRQMLSIFLLLQRGFFYMFRNVNVQFNRIFNNTFFKRTLCCYKRAFCSRLKHCFYAKEKRLLLPTGCEFLAKAHRMFAAIFFGGSTTLLLYITSITRSQTVFKQCFSTCNL